MFSSNSKVPIDTNEWTIKDAVLASTATPDFYSAAKVKTKNNVSFEFIDGGEGGENYN